MIFDTIRYKLYTFVYGKGLPSHILKRSGFQDELIEVINMIQENKEKRYIEGIENRIIDTETGEEFVCNSYWETIEDILCRLNKQDQQIKEYEKKITKLEEIIDNRLDKNVRPKWQNNNELFIEEKAGYYYALEQLKKKLIREKICFNDINIEEWEF